MTTMKLDASKKSQLTQMFRNETAEKNITFYSAKSHDENLMIEEQDPEMGKSLNLSEMKGVLRSSNP